MKQLKRLITVLVILGLALPFALVSTAFASGPVTENYGSLTLHPGWEVTHWSHVWDLTQGDLTLSYIIDMTGVVQPSAWNTSYTEVGIRQVGGTDYNPGPWNTYQGGSGAWMASLVGNLAPSPGGQSLHDKHNLSASGGRGEGDYDATIPTAVTAPFGNANNYGIWFDRDSIDQYQVNNWGAVNGGTYNTAGIYDIVLTYHAIDSGLGTVFATLNGIPTGFYTAGWKNAQPEIYPAGLSFKGNMTRMQVFAGIWAPDATYGPVTVSDITVEGVLADIFSFTGFLQPVDNSAVNIARAGQTVPVKWLLTDQIGLPVSDPNSFTRVYSYRVNCDTLADENTDAIEQYAGSSGLQYLGDGYWQANWKTPKTYANTCRRMYVEFADGSTSPVIDFKFK